MKEVDKFIIDVEREERNKHKGMAPETRYVFIWMKRLAEAIKKDRHAAEAATKSAYSTPTANSGVVRPSK